MNTLKILRGIPGAGKSTLALGEGAHGGVQDYPVPVCSADAFFTDAKGVYRFNPAELGEAHGGCFRAAVTQCQRGSAFVVIDNTNLSVAECAPYVLMGQAYGYDVEIITLRCDPAVAAARNVHGVPSERVAAMALALDAASATFPPWWAHRVIEAGQ